MLERVRITFISHASVIVETSDRVIWTDPWVFGKAFNDSWALMPEPPGALIDEWLPRITDVWVSHEHPDHFHIPTLKSLPADFKRRVVLLFQELHTDRMPDAFRALGFLNVVTIKHRAWKAISAHTSVYMYQEAPLDAGIAIKDGQTGELILNVNDVELSDYDIDILKNDLGTIDVVLNQFSFATYDGREDYATVTREQAERILTSIVDDHRGLDARVTIPFASFMYFCAPDNFHLNAFRNSPRAVAERFAQHGLRLAVLLPGETYEVGREWDNRASLARYDAMQEVPRPRDQPKRVDLGDLEKDARALFADMHRYYPTTLLRLTGHYRIFIEDLGETVLFGLGSGTWRPLGSGHADWDIKVLSQPLQFALKNSFGLQTLSISGRFLIRRHLRRFMLLRILMGLRNAELFLRPRFILRAPLRSFIAVNASRLVHQFFGVVGVLKTFIGRKPAMPAATNR